MEAIRMKIEDRDIGDIRPYPGNPRLNDEAIDVVAASLREFGFRQPIVVDEAGVIVCGHTRWKAAQRLGMSHVPVHVAGDLSPAQIKAYRIADNATGERAEWDYELLPIEMEAIRDTGFDMSILGFDEDELLGRLAESNGGDKAKDRSSEPAKPDASPVLGSVIEYRIMIECRDESHQIELIERFDAEEISYKAMIS